MRDRPRRATSIQLSGSTERMHKGTRWSAVIDGTQSTSRKEGPGPTRTSFQNMTTMKLMID